MKEQTVTVPFCSVASIRADMVKNKVKITFEANLTEFKPTTKHYLQLIAANELSVKLEITGQQMLMPELLDLDDLDSSVEIRRAGSPV